MTQSKVFVERMLSKCQLAGKRPCTCGATGLVGK